ncbi:uncharacterized protein LOC128198895 [Bicyclus anynana]|uniref:Uncharacterized protein LOC128198895 n=1 Tax=Bicyclus anynana TaxID=110368 RepID=A0ABM3LTI4_BICAN|nr:uncharacterized protein LOC128198895 [Bicyclus anynana]
MASPNNASVADSQGEIAGIALSMRVPPFWRDKPRLWFISFEAATADLKKSQDQLAQMVVAQLQKEDIEQISDILFDPPATDLYTAVKNRLISAYEESDSRQLQKLLSEIELGDQKPTQLLRRMRFLAREKVPDSTLRILWTNHLPSHVRSVLAASESFSTKTALDELAILADKMVESSPSSHIAAVESPSTSVPPSDTKFLVEEIRKLSLEVAALKMVHQNCQHRGRPNYRRNRSNSNGRRSRSSTPSPYCFYHRRFGAAARRCTKPCSYQTKPEN